MIKDKKVKTPRNLFPLIPLFPRNKRKTEESIDTSSSDDSIDQPLELREKDRKKTIATFLKKGDREILKGPKFVTEITKHTSFQEVKTQVSLASRLKAFGQDRNFVSNEFWSEKHYKSIMKFSMIDEIKTEMRNLRWRKKKPKAKKSDSQNQDSLMYSIPPEFYMMNAFSRNKGRVEEGSQLDLTESFNNSIESVRNNRKQAISFQTILPRGDSSIPQFNESKEIKRSLFLPLLKSDSAYKINEMEVKLNQDSNNKAKANLNCLINECGEFLDSTRTLNNEISNKIGNENRRKQRRLDTLISLNNQRTETLESCFGPLPCLPSLKFSLNKNQKPKLDSVNATHLLTKESTFIETESDISTRIDPIKKFASFHSKLYSSRK